MGCLFENLIINEEKYKNKDSIDEIKQELLKRFFKPIYIPLIALLCCMLFLSGKFNNNYERLKLIFY